MHDIFGDINAFVPLGYAPLVGYHTSETVQLPGAPPLVSVFRGLALAPARWSASAPSWGMAP